MAISDDLLEEICAEIKKRVPGVLAVYAFGSQISGFAGAESDLDLAVLAEGYAQPALLWDLANGKLADMAGMPVDLLDLRAASTIMQHQALSAGKRLYAKNSAADSYECFVFREKFWLDEKNAGICSDIIKRGYVYGK